MLDDMTSLAQELPHEPWAFGERIAELVGRSLCRRNAFSSCAVVQMISGAEKLLSHSVPVAENVDVVESTSVSLLASLLSLCWS